MAHFRIPSPKLRGLAPLVAAVLLVTWVFSSAPAQSPIAKAQAPPAGGKELLDRADDILLEVSKITGLPIKAPLKKQVVSRKEVERYVVENLHAENTPQEIRAQEAALQAFGLVPRDFDLGKFLVTFYSEQAAGFYDPRHKTMFIADWVAEEMQTLVLAHELTHALQDQNFDLDKFLKAVKDDDDAANARQAIAEGHATAAMVQRMVQPVPLVSLPSLEPIMAEVIQQQMQEFPVFSKSPYFFRLQALFPYSEGVGFVEHALHQGGWEKLKNLFSNPPTSTREIYHPAVYSTGETQTKTKLPHPPPLAGVSALRLLTENTLGELGYRALVGQLISDDEAKSVGNNWRGDRYILYERSREASAQARNASQYILIGRARWSSGEAAMAFFRDYHSILVKKYPELAPDERSSDELFLGTAASGQVIVLSKGDESRWAEGVPAAQADAMLAWLRSL